MVYDFVKDLSCSRRGQEPRVALREAIAVVAVFRVPAQGHAHIQVYALVVHRVQNAHLLDEPMQGVQDGGVVHVKGHAQVQV